MQDKTKYINRLLLGGVLFYAWMILVQVQGNLLFMAQEFNPFLGTTAYFDQIVCHPGGLREWVGDWLTQLFYYPWLGATVQVILWAIGVIALVKAFRLKRSMQSLTLIPVIALLASMTQLGYWTFCLKTPSYWMGPTVGFVCVSLAMWLYTSLNGVGRIIMLPLWILIGFPVLGWYATLGLVAMLLMGPMASQGFFQHWPRWLTVATGLSAFSLAAITLYYQDSTSLHWREPLLLYGFHHVEIPEASSILMEVPFRVMAGVIVALPIVSHLRRFRIVANHGWIISIPLLLAALYGGMMLNYRNVNFHTELALMKNLENGEWKEMLQTIGQQKQRPTREMVMMKDVALAQIGQLGEKAFAYDVRAVRPQMASGVPIHMAHSAGMYFYYWLGLPNYAYMWCMENGIEYGLSPYLLKLMYRCAKINGEEVLAQKYKALLQTTLFHGDIELTEAECVAVSRFIPNVNLLSNDKGFPEGFVMKQLAHVQYNTPVAQQLALHYAMLIKNKDAFEIALAHYKTLVGEETALPRYVQEAVEVFARDSSQDDERVTFNNLPYSATYRWYYDNYNDFKTY